MNIVFKNMDSRHLFYNFIKLKSIFFKHFIGINNCIHVGVHVYLYIMYKILKIKLLIIKLDGYVGITVNCY